MPSIIWPDTTKDNWLWPLSLVYLLENIFLGLFLYVHVLLIVYRGPFTWTALSGPTCGILDVWHLSVASREMELLGTDVDVVGGTEGAILTELSILLICTHFTLFLIVFFYGSPGTRTHKRPMVLDGGVADLGGIQMSSALGWDVCYANQAVPKAKGTIPLH